MSYFQLQTNAENDLQLLTNAKENASIIDKRVFDSWRDWKRQMRKTFADSEVNKIKKSATAMSLITAIV